MDSTESVHFPPQALNCRAMNNASFPHTENTQEIFDKGAIKNKPRRKKAARACLHCQKSHLTCSDERPCKRCVIRGLVNECCDGQRKKAKYLIEPEDAAHSKDVQTEDMISLNQQAFMPTAVSLEAFQNSLPMLPPNYGTSQAFLMDPTQEYGFFSETANLEHDMLINMASQFMVPELGSYQGFPAFPLAETWTPLNPAPPPLSVTSLPHPANKQQYSVHNQTLNHVSPLLGKKI
ncbi:Transcriptional regulator of nonfermentable carbon utilization [Entomophthora muscae]|uniref:Transcriptional regulator of nonfermentable carbon utilization n=1 Tax=Entomophthora muscae TaxID=34485 RepID=A0ACC2SYB4_9FUNG|nr:Transcriptional regulator of nonfermentable carbon utilization [Entomophthora muscae]